MEGLAREIMIAAVAAAALTILFVFRTRNRSHFPVWAMVFVLMFAAAFAGGLMFRPIGPYPESYKWMQFAIIGFFSVLVYTLFAPRRPAHGRHETLDKLEQMDTARELQNITFTSLLPIFVLVGLMLVFAVIIQFI